MRGFSFTRDQIGQALNLLGLPPVGHRLCPVVEAPVAEFDGGRLGETALTLLADDVREGVALAMQLAALVCDPDEVADLHTRLTIGVDPHGGQCYQFRGYHLEQAQLELAQPAREPAQPSSAA